jgi:hypothetical protein
MVTLVSYYVAKEGNIFIDEVMEHVLAKPFIVTELFIKPTQREMFVGGLRLPKVLKNTI